MPPSCSPSFLLCKFRFPVYLIHGHPFLISGNWILCRPVPAFATLHYCGSIFHCGQSVIHHPTYSSSPSAPCFPGLRLIHIILALAMIRDSPLGWGISRVSTGLRSGKVEEGRRRRPIGALSTRRAVPDRHSPVGHAWHR